MASATRLDIGLATQNLACLAGIRIGEVQSVSNFHFSSQLELGMGTEIDIFSSGLATNFLLIESLQRFYQYYGDDLQVGFWYPMQMVSNYLPAG